jgi:hypothetical protein
MAQSATGSAIPVHNVNVAKPKRQAGLGSRKTWIRQATQGDKNERLKPAIETDADKSTT